MNAKKFTQIAMAVVLLAFALPIVWNKLNDGGEVRGLADYESKAERLKRWRSQAAAEVQEYCREEVGFVRVVNSRLSTSADNPSAWSAKVDIDVLTGVDRVARKTLKLRGYVSMGDFGWRSAVKSDRLAGQN